MLGENQRMMFIGVMDDDRIPAMPKRDMAREKVRRSSRPGDNEALASFSLEQHFNLLRHEAMRPLSVIHQALAGVDRLLRSEKMSPEHIKRTRPQVSDALRELEFLDRLVRIGFGRSVARLEAKLRQLLFPTHDVPASPIGVARAVAEALKDLAPQRKEAAIRFNLRIDPQVHILAHQKPIDAMIRAIVAAAIRRATPGTDIGCRWSEDKRVCVLEVASIGPGVPMAEMLRAFDIADEDTGRSDEHQEALYLARSIARRYGFETSYQQDRVQGEAEESALRRHRFELLLSKSSLAGDGSDDA
jgi:K+-sensing histidine kinase KdpD